MAKQRVTIHTEKITTTRRRVRKTGGNTGYKKCPVCRGTGRVKQRGR